MVCNTGTANKKKTPPLSQNKISSSRSQMDVQRAKKCKLWSEGDQQLQSTTDPCPLLQPFCHQVSFCLFVFLKYKTLILILWLGWWPYSIPAIGWVDCLQASNSQRAKLLPERTVRYTHFHATVQRWEQQLEFKGFKFEASSKTSSQFDLLYIQMHIPRHTHALLW